MIPVNEPWLGESEERYVLECLRTGWISSAGPFIERFESAWAEYCGTDHGIAVSNGTTALYAAMASLKLDPGDEVIMPTFTFIGCAHAIRMAGAIPVLVDSDPHTWCMNVSHIEQKLSPRTRAIMPVHIYGHPVDMGPLCKLAEKHDLHVIEDAAEAPGATYEGCRTGGLGDIGCFSFYANKILTTGEGGMVTTNDVALADRVRSYRNMAFRTDRRFLHTEVGHNYRLTNVQAAIGLAQVETVDQRVSRKREIGARYNEALGGTEGLQLPVEMPWASNVYWMYGLVLGEDTGFDATTFADAMRESGIDTRPFFIGMHEQPVFLDQGLFVEEAYPVADRIARQGLYLPSGLTITDQQIAEVADVVRKVVAR